MGALSESDQCDKSNKSDNPVTNKHPFFSIIIPVYKQWARVPELLKALKAQTLAASDFEILLINNASPDFPENLQLPTNAQVSHCQKAGSYAARNQGIQLARGEWLVFTDADCLPKLDWLANLRQAIQTAPNQQQIFAGAIQMQASDQPNWLETYDLLRGIPQENYVKKGYAATANLTFSKAASEQQLFNDQRFSGGDAELCRQLVAQGYQLSYLPQACVHHPARKTWQEVVTKVRRIKGGQLTAGTRQQRVKWAIKTLIPPVKAYWRYLSNQHFTWQQRLRAICIESLLWIFAIQEMLNLLIFKKTPERS